nr:putative harbinger transposase-derived protein [Tanacetum cinerariifolium]
MRPDATGQMSFSIIMKCISVIRQLTYDTSPNALDEYLEIGEHTARDSLDHFTKCVIELFMPEYLRKPDFNDTQKFYTAHNADHGFPRMLGSIIVCTGNGLIIQKHGTGNLRERTWIERCEMQRRKAKELRDRHVHASLQRNLIDHVWQQHQHQHQQGN